MYERCGFDASSSPTTLFMLSDLEARLEDLLSDIAQMPVEYVAKAEKASGIFARDTSGCPGARSTMGEAMSGCMRAANTQHLLVDRGPRRMLHPIEQRRGSERSRRVFRARSHTSQAPKTSCTTVHSHGVHESSRCISRRGPLYPWHFAVPYFKS